MKKELILASILAVSCSYGKEERPFSLHTFSEFIHDADNKRYRVDFVCAKERGECYKAENIHAIHQYPFVGYGSSIEASFILQEEKCEAIPETYCYILTEDLRKAALENVLAREKLKDTIRDAKIY